MLKRAAGVRPSAVTMTPVVEQLVGDLDRGLEHAARIVAQVEYQAARPGAEIAAQARDAGGEIQRGGIAEGGDARVDEAAVEFHHRHAVHFHLRALHGELQRQRRTGAHHRQLDARTARAAHAGHCGVEIVAHRQAIDGGDQVAAADAGGGGG